MDIVSNETFPDEFHLRAADILGRISDAFFALDTEWRFTYLNDQAERLFQKTRGELLGKSLWSEFPEMADSAVSRGYRRAMAEQAAVTVTEFFAPLDAWFEVRAFPSENGLSIFFQNVNERGRRERFLADLAERARTLTDPDAVIADALRSVGQFLGVSRCVFADIDIEADTCTVPADYRADETVTSIAGTFPISAFGPFVVAEYRAGRTAVVDDVRADPDKAPLESLAAYESIGVRAYIAAPVVHSARLVSAVAVHNATPRHWKLEEAELLQTVVERTWLTVEVTRQQRALAHGAEERRKAHALTESILESITDAFFTLNRDWNFVRINDSAERLMTKKRDEILGRNFWEAYPHLLGSVFEREYRRAMEEGVAVSFQVFYSPLDAWLDVRAYPSADGLSVFYQDVTARKTAEDERERLLAEARARGEREALLNRIGQSLRRAPDPEQVLEAAVRELGQALDVDRCYYAAYDQAGDTATAGPDWRREGLPSIAGRYPMSRFTVNRDPEYKAGKTQVVPDTCDDPATLNLGLRALVRVPLVSGTSMTALSVAMADEPRAWTPEEVALVEAVATQTQTALEAALVSRKERLIAQQLQDALQPELPEHIPGLAIGRFTRPALDEAQVGGDFYDVFPLDKELYALVIGDVSGKGLAAAQQLALIRNSLRTALYLTRDAAQAVTTLNKIVTVHDLLVGFVTAFVGVYDSSTGSIMYASCGHEPGLVRRAGGTVEQLQTTGPPLGVDESADYHGLTVTLRANDVLLLYTDGLSEAGPSRRTLFGTAGLEHLLESLPEGADAQTQAQAVVAGVGDFAGGVFRDDVAVLLLRRT